MQQCVFVESHKQCHSSILRLADLVLNWAFMNIIGGVSYTLYGKPNLAPDVLIEVYWNDTVYDFRQIHTVASTFYRAVGYSPPLLFTLDIYLYCLI